MRIYKVKMANSEVQPRLVMAGNPAQALRFVTNGLFEVAPATARDVAGLMAAGAKVENNAPDDLKKDGE